MKFLIIGLIVIACVAVGMLVVRSRQVQASQKELAALIATLPPVKMDFTTPEGAILSLEDGYRRKDIEAAVASKDFATESRLMMTELKKPIPDDPKLQKEAAAVLELSFRKHTQESWPDFSESKSYFIKRVPYKDKMVVVTEACRYPDGGFSIQKLVVTETPKGWRVVSVLD
jgi:hypothetical protein